ncbi:MAG: EscU/YscU/HrcU family type III secretion system export apparatus switch protein [Dactylosporangium sp.]|nr:EscU/YscU/HrcU family type III secretion system export apparatus switch protein [Dactylosporangium sp.]NNJ61279.1 EscU/YscU/HrcU family type III secretion system export apparatus switch protein [Dactylosporangium sp.]
MTGEKTEEPTEQRKKQARREGQIPRTPDFGTWGGLLVASLLLPMTVSNLADRVHGLMITIAATIDNPSDQQALLLLQTGLRDVAIVAAPLGVALFAFSIAASGVQGGLRPAAKLFMPKFNRLSPLSGFKRILGPRALWEAVKALAKTAVLGTVLYLTISDLVPRLLTSGSFSLETILATVASTATNLIRTAAVAGIVLAIADYAMARRRIGKQTRMSKHEVKEEHRRTEGDPQVKSAIRSKQLAMSRQRMMAELPKADVVLVNPTHVAVALRYDPAKGAPRIIAKGAGAVAAKIRQKAMELRIPMVQDKALARSLYRDCDLGAEIPAHFYETVARILAFIMMLKAKGSAAGLHRPTLS